MQPEDFSKAIEEAYKTALKEADKIVANAQKIRKEAEKELDAAREIHREAEKKADKLAEEYFAGRTTQFWESARTGVLRELVLRALKFGAQKRDIMSWLDVEPEFVEQIETVRNRVIDYHKKNRVYPEGNPKLTYSDEGRGGTIWYRNGDVKFDMWWEFAGGAALVIVDIPTQEQWEGRTGIPLEQRDVVLTFIGDQILEDKMHDSGQYLIGFNVITFFVSDGGMR